MILICIASLVAVLACLHQIGELDDQIEILNAQVADLQKKTVTVSDDIKTLQCQEIKNGRLIG